MATGTTSILVVDDEPHVCCLITDVLSNEQVQCTSVNSGEKAMRLLLEKYFDVIIMDLLLPDVSGMDLLGFISRRRLRTRVICVSGEFSSLTRQDVFKAGAFDFFEKPFDVSRLTESVQKAVEMHHDSSDDSGEVVLPDEDFASGRGDSFSRSGLAGDSEQAKQILLGATSALIHVVEAKDPYTRRHSDHVAYYAEKLARCVGASKAEIEIIRVAALLHDIGMIAVPNSVLTKPGKLSKVEFSLVRRHPDVGAEILKNIAMLRAEARLVRYHHENWDGSGYPSGIGGDEIPQGSQIISIADNIDAMLMHRTYKQAYSANQMLEELGRYAGKKHDPDLVCQAIAWCRNNTRRLILPEDDTRAKTA